MQLKYGSYQFVANECDVRARTTVNVVGGKPVARRTVLEVLGRFYCDSQSDCTTKQNALVTALASPYQDLILYQDDGSISATLLRNSGSLGGVVIIDGPNFEENHGAEYATQRSFSFSAAAEYPLVTGQTLLSFEESLSFRGGGPKNIFRPNLNGAWQKQLVYPLTTYKASQRGKAVGYQFKPTPPGPIWPADEQRDQRRTDEFSPERHGTSFKGYGIEWSYEFESIRPLVGSPNTWPSNM